MKYLMLISVMTFWFAACAQSTSKAEEKTAIENTVRDYVEGWYKGDTVRISRSLHDDLVKRIPVKDDSDLDTKLRMDGSREH